MLVFEWLTRLRPIYLPFWWLHHFGFTKVDTIGLRHFVFSHLLGVEDNSAITVLFWLGTSSLLLHIPFSIATVEHVALCCFQEPRSFCGIRHSLCGSCFFGKSLNRSGFHLICWISFISHFRMPLHLFWHYFVQIYLHHHIEDGPVLYKCHLFPCASWFSSEIIWRHPLSSYNWASNSFKE